MRGRLHAPAALYGVTDIFKIQSNSTYLDAGYPDRLGLPSKFFGNFTKLTCLEITGHRIKYSTVLWL